MLFRGRKLPIKEEPKKSSIKRQSQPSASTASIPPIVQQDKPAISNGALILEPMDNTPSSITTPQDLRNVLSPMSPVEIDNINPEPEDPESGRFLASLIAQGLTGLGAGLMGGSSQDILRSTGMFDRMRESDINRQDRLMQSKLLRTERLGEKQERLAEIKKREEQAKSLTDPNSEESKRDRLLYEKVLKTKIPEEVTAFDLRNRPEIVRSLMTQAEQSILAAMPRGGVGIGKENKEDQKNIQSFKDATAENNKFLKQLDEYSNLVKKIPLTGGTYASGASTIESAKVLRGKLLLQLKNIEKTGALDAGMIAIADQILGTPDYTRDEVVDAKTNQLKRAIQDDIQTNAVKFGIIGTVEGEDGNLYYIDKNNNPIMKVQ